MNTNLSRYVRRRLRQTLLAALESGQLNSTVKDIVASFLVTGTYEHDPNNLLNTPASLLDYEVRFAVRCCVEPSFFDSESKRSCRTILMWLRS